MARKIVKHKAFWPAAILLMLCLAVLSHYALIERVGAAGDAPATSITVGNVAPYITSVVFYYGAGTFTPTEWTLAAGGTRIATTTFTVTDDNTCSDIATTSLYIYHVNVANCSTSAQADINNCYPATSTDGAVRSAWTPRYGAGNLCDQTSCTGNNATFLCTTTFHFTATSTDADATVWMVFASTSDLSYAQANRSTNPGSATMEVGTLQALEVSNDIAYATLGAGQDSGTTWVTTDATSTGNKIIDIKFHGGSLTKTDDNSIHISAFKQQFTTTSGLTYSNTDPVGEGLIRLPTTTDGFTGDVHDVTILRATTTPPGSTCGDRTYWGIGIPTGLITGDYASTTNFIVTNAIVNP